MSESTVCGLDKLALRVRGLDIRDVGNWEFETQYRIPSGARPDIALWSEQHVFVLVESKLDAGLTEAQAVGYTEFLARREESLRSLVLVTKRYEPWPYAAESLAASTGIRLVAESRTSTRTSTGPHIEHRSHIENGVTKPFPRGRSSVNGRSWDRTSDLPRVKRALSR